ncbi:MAG: ribose 5-phosphate isomerase B [Planctomycetota bacterium]
MKIAIGNDHAAFAEKASLMEKLQSMGHEVANVGTDDSNSVDYPDVAAKVGRLVANKEADFGVLLCGSGIGISIAANKINGVRAALCHSDLSARLAREHNDANVLCLGARVLGSAQLESAMETFLATEFAGGRHRRRVDKMTALEKEKR